MRGIIWSAEALSDLAALRRYIAKDDPAAAKRVVQRIHESVSQLAVTKAKGRPGRVTGTRELVVVGTPYLVPYRVTGEAVEMIAVFHSSRQWPESFF
jgi:toxin ParE1/3/4